MLYLATDSNNSAALSTGDSASLERPRLEGSSGRFFE